MVIDFGGSGGAQGPFLNWQARESLDGEFKGKSWVMRGEGGKVAFTNMARGVVFDVDALKLGWCKGDGTPGVAPVWRWNASISRFEPSPGEEWKRGFSIPIGISTSEIAVWEQSQAGSFAAMQDLFLLISKAQRNAGTLPVIRHNGEKKIESKRGMTFAPILEIVKWTPRPEIMGGGDATGPDFASEPPRRAPAQRGPAQRGPAPAMADMDDDIPF